jgi:hypothetical protein
MRNLSLQKKHEKEDQKQLACKMKTTILGCFETAGRKQFLRFI